MIISSTYILGIDVKDNLEAAITIARYNDDKVEVINTITGDKAIEITKELLNLK